MCKVAPCALGIVMDFGSYSVAAVDLLICLITNRLSASQLEDPTRHRQRIQVPSMRQMALNLSCVRVAQRGAHGAILPGGQDNLCPEGSQDFSPASDRDGTWSGCLQMGRFRMSLCTCLFPIVC